MDAGGRLHHQALSTQELLARIRAVLRRRAPEQVSDSVSIGELVPDAATYRVTFQGQPLKVGPSSKLLHFPDEAC